MKALIMMGGGGFAYFMSISVAPQQIMAILLAQAFLMTIYMGLTNLSIWLPYALFLIFLGGLMVLFMYMMSLTPNFFPGLYLSKSKSAMWSSLTLLMMMTIFFMDNMGEGIDLVTPDYSAYMKNMFSLEGSLMYSYIVLYLLAALLSITWVVKFGEGPLRRLSWYAS